MSPMFGERALKTPLYGASHIPSEVAELERVVCQLEFTDRYIIIQRWQRHRSYRELARLIGVSTWRIGKLLKGAEAEVHRLLETPYCTAQTQRVYGVDSSKTVSGGFKHG